MIARYPRREGPARPARLRRSDRQDAAICSRRRRGRLGALQARPRHRPRADRRGAGHQPEAVGDHQAAGRRILRRHGRARPSRARSSRSATRSSRSSRSRARRRASSPRCGGTSSAAHRDGRAATSSRASSSTRSAPARTCSTRSTRCSRRATASPGLTTDAAGVPLHERAARQPRPAWSKSVAAGQAGREARDRGLGRAVRRAHETEPARCGSRGRIASASWIAGTWRARRARRAGRRSGAGAPARRAVRGDHPRAEERRASRSPAPTGWC